MKAKEERTEDRGEERCGKAGGGGNEEEDL